METDKLLEIAIGLEELHITTEDLSALQTAICMNDQDLVNSQFAYMHDDIEKLEIYPHNLSKIIRSLEKLESF